MRIGTVLPTLGTAPSPAGVVHVAQRAEALGYDGLWAPERVLYPLNPRSPYPATPDGSLPVR